MSMLLRSKKNKKKERVKCFYFLENGNENDFTVECVCVCEALRFSDASGRHAVSQKNGDDG
jgi:hypothetical protein